MKLGAMISDIIESVFKKPVTERYPFERKEAPAQLRGKLLWHRESCTGCGLCAKDCPANAIEVIVLDRKAKQFVFNYYVDRCLFCAQCVHSCRQGSLEMQPNLWELAELDRDHYLLHYGDENDIRAYLEGPSSADAEPAESKKAGKPAIEPAGS
jgi:NAD(P)H-quinone oxidoreductase subunit I